MLLINQGSEFELCRHLIWKCKHAHHLTDIGNVAELGNEPKIGSICESSCTLPLLKWLITCSLQRWRTK